MALCDALQFTVWQKMAACMHGQQGVHAPTWAALHTACMRDGLQAHNTACMHVCTTPV